MTIVSCSIPPLDQSTTSVGWRPGLFVYSSCPATGPCGYQEPGLQFLADPGTPVIAPFQMTVVQTSPMYLLRAEPNVPIPMEGRADLGELLIRLTDVTPAAHVGAVLQKGDLLGRIASGARGTKWILWGRGRDGINGQQSGIETMFDRLGLEIVGSTRPNLPQYTTISSFGGRMYAQTGSPADCASGGMHGLGRGLSAYLGSAPTGYAETPSSVYSRYGTSTQTDRSVPNPTHENALVHVTAAQAGGAGVVLLALGLGVAWALRNG